MPLVAMELIFQEVDFLAFLIPAPRLGGELLEKLLLYLAITMPIELDSQYL